MSFLLDTRVWENLGTYNTEDKEIVGVRVAVPKPEKLAVELSTNITWGWLVGGPRSEIKPRIPVIWSVTLSQDAGLID